MRLELSDENKRKPLDRSESFLKWAEEKWTPFVVLMHEGDELWRFRSPPWTWANKAGRAGHAIVRDGAIVHELVMMLS